MFVAVGQDQSADKRHIDMLSTQLYLSMDCARSHMSRGCICASVNANAVNGTTMLILTSLVASLTLAVLRLCDENDRYGVVSLIHNPIYQNHSLLMETSV